MVRPAGDVQDGRELPRFWGPQYPPYLDGNCLCRHIHFENLKYGVCECVFVQFSVCIDSKVLQKKFLNISANLYKDDYLSLWRRKENLNVEVRLCVWCFYIPLSCNAICCLCRNATSRPKAFFCLSSSFRSTKIFNCRHSLSFF